MNAQIERVLQKLIEQHGIDKIDEALTPLIAQFKWDDWQRVYNLAHRLSRRKQVKSAKRRKNGALK
jgi:predicted amidophosphoribosyltransferase